MKNLGDSKLSDLRDIERRLTQDAADMWRSIMDKHQQYAELHQAIGEVRMAIRQATEREAATCPECDHPTDQHLDRRFEHDTYGCCEGECACPLQPAAILAGATA